MLITYKREKTACTETWVIDIEKNKEIRHILLVCHNSNVVEMTINGGIVDRQDYVFIKQDLQTVKIVIPALTFAILNDKQISISKSKQQQQTFVCFSTTNNNLD